MLKSLGTFLRDTEDSGPAASQDRAVPTPGRGRMQNMQHHKECPETPSHKTVGNIKSRALLEVLLKERDSP